MLARFTDNYIYKIKNVIKYTKNITRIILAIFLVYLISFEFIINFKRLIKRIEGP